jgi:hypothetical protein
LVPCSIPTFISSSRVFILNTRALPTDEERELHKDIEGARFVVSIQQQGVLEQTTAHSLLDFSVFVFAVVFILDLESGMVHEHLLFKVEIVLGLHDDKKSALRP